MLFKLSLSSGAFLLALVILSGCGGGPAAILPPHIDADRAAELAMENYDTDKNGFVEGEELDKAPGLKAAMATLDSNKDSKVSEEEVAARVRAWRGTGVGITTIQCSVTLDGRPLAGASITFEPEGFLGEEIQSAVATTGPLGEFYPLIPKENLPSANSPVGIQLGLYKIKVSKLVDGTEKIPAKYNSETILGQEVSNDDPGIQRHSLVYKLTSK